MIEVPMLTYPAALETIQEIALLRRLGTERVLLQDAVGRVCAEDIYAELDIQPFDNSAMDGFAVRVEDLSQADNLRPARLRKAGMLAAGTDPAGLSLEKGSCWQVMTGAALPSGAEAVVPIEMVSVEEDLIVFSQKAEAGQHIRYAGEDFKKGAPVLFKGQTITVAHILPLATLGIGEIEVFKKPRILFIPTGTEVIDNLGERLENGQIYNSNKFYAASFLCAAGADITLHETIPDDLGTFRKALTQAQSDNYDIIISSGAVSAGNFDFVREGLEKADAKILYHKIKLKPGKPNLLATLPSGALYFGLPGNPVATAAGLRFLVVNALRVMQNQKPEKPFSARASNRFTKPAGLHMILKGKIEYGDEGSVTVTVLDGQESFKVNPFLTMNCWIHVPGQTTSVETGDIVQVYPLSA